MEQWSRKEEACPQLLDLIPKNTVWLTNRENKDGSRNSLEEKKLELRLGPPGENWSLKDTSKKNNIDSVESVLSLGYVSPMASISQKNNNINNENQTLKFSSISPWCSSYKGKNVQHSQQHTKAPPFLQLSSVPQSLPVAAKDTSQSQICGSKAMDLRGPEKVFSQAPNANTTVPNSSQKRYSNGKFSFFFNSS